MAMIEIKASRCARIFRAALLAGVFAGAAGLGACSQVPDAVNPASWYRNTVDFFAGEKKTDEGKKDKAESGLKADRGKAPPGSDKAFPNLASVDEKAAARGLSADPDRPKYAPAIQRQGEAPAALPPEKPAQVAVATPPGGKPVMPPPAAAPTTPVMPAPAPPPAAQAMPNPPAAAPMPAPAMPEASPPMATTPEQKDAEARLTRRLAEIRRRADQQAELAQSPAPSAALAAGETIVVSSAGIETQGGAQDLPPTVSIPPAPPGAGAAPPMAQGPAALPVPSGAVRVATILFGNGSASLQARDKTILGAVSRLQRQKGGVIRVVGHASARTRNLPPIKRKMVNFKISIDRADSIAAELARLGVAKDKLLVAAVSDAEPQYYEFMPSGEAGNRRAEIYLSN